MGKRKFSRDEETPALFLGPPSSRNEFNNSNGFKIVVPEIIDKELETIIPIKEVKAKQIGTAINCGQIASSGFHVQRAKSGALTINGAK